jgi:GGDEF domain-containing protein
MLSIREAVDNLDRLHQMRAKALECYLEALRDMARYTVELDESITSPHRKSLEDLADRVSSGGEDVLNDSRGLLRALLREYRDRSSAYLGSLKDELGETAKALEEILESLSRDDGDEETRLKNALNGLRELSNSPAAAAIRKPILAATDGIDQSLEGIRRRHQLNIAEFQIEIRMLHQRIDSLETAAAVDSVTNLLKRPDMEELIDAAAGQYCLVLVRVGGFHATEKAFSNEVAIDLAGAFTKRLRNSVPPTTVISRWGHEEFVAMLPASKVEVMPIAKWIAEHLSGAYSILQDGKLVHPRIQVSVVVVEGGVGKSDTVLDRMGEFLTGR